MSKNIFSWGLIILMGAFLFIFYSSVLKNPNDYSFSAKGDGIKNYYVFVASLKSQNPSLEFDHMNYPYGEGLLFVDAHPVLALALTTLSKPFPSLHKYGVGILNFLMISSLLITAILLKKIFDILKIHPLLAVLGAFSISLLNAQIFRMHGHFALAYGFFVPSIIYGILQIEVSKKGRVWLLYLALLSAIYFFIHAYAGLIASVLIVIYSFIKFLLSIKNKKKIIEAIYLGMSGVIPLGFFYVIAKIFDKHTGRTTNPWGLFEYHADLETIFLPILGPFNSFKWKWFAGIPQQEEGWAYVGVITMIGLLFLFFRSLFFSIKNRTVSLDKGIIKEQAVRILFVSSFIILMISMLIPIRFGMEAVVEWFPIIKQFRSIGRFAMVFYFGSTIALIVMANSLIEYLREQKKLFFAYLLLFSVPMMLYAEAVSLHKDMSYNITRAKNLFKLENTSPSFQKSIEKLAQKEYQAVLILPFFCQGSENFGLVGQERTLQLAFLSSYYLELPLIGNLSARSSIWESKNMMQLMSSSFYDKPIIDEFDGDLPILIVARKMQLHPNEEAILSKAEKIIEGEDFSYYEISKRVYFEKTNEIETARFESIKDSLYERSGFFVSDSSLHFEFNDFSKPGVLNFANNDHSVASRQKDYFKFITIEPNSLPKGDYTARFWMYNDGENYGQNQLAGIVFFEKSYEGKVNWVSITDPKESFEINGNWSLIEIPLNYDNPNAKYTLLYIGDKKSQKEAYFKDFLFYDSNLEVYKTYKSEGKNYLFKNNHRIEH